MKTTKWALAIALSLGLAAPAYAGDTQDTVDEKTAETKKGLRDLKPGDKTAADRKDDAKDSMKAASAKTKKKARAAKRKVKKEAHDATH